jgi:hypothetical protein
MIIHEIMETPEGINGKSIVDSICNILGQDEDTNDNAKHRSKHPKYFKFTADQLSQLIVACSPAPLTPTPFVSRSPTSLIGTTLITPTYVVNAKYKEISCKPIKTLYDVRRMISCHFSFNLTYAIKTRVGPQPPI